ncbi:MAG TPA: hypothetical protein VGM88_32780 [Kofleriaceae bacterium]
MKRVFAIGVALALGGAVSCGDNKNAPTDGTSGSDGGSDTGSDGPPNTSNLTGYVIDLVTNHTNATETPRAFTEFQALPDPDGTNNNTTAYSSLFP